MNTHQFLHTLTAAGAALSLALACGTARADNFDYEHQKERRLESGASQSPIDIASKDAVRSEHYDDEKDDIVVHAARGGASVIDNGHTVQVVLKDSSGTIRGRHFALVQTHFHAPAEHEIDGKRYPLEGHFVFRAPDGRLAVVAVLYRENAGNEQFAAIVKAARRDHAVALPVFDAAALMPHDIDHYYHYLGSLTTPPLSENVEWYVLADPVDLSRDDIAEFTRLYAHNARQPQPLNGRPLLEYKD